MGSLRDVCEMLNGDVGFGVWWFVVVVLCGFVFDLREFVVCDLL